MAHRIIISIIILLTSTICSLGQGNFLFNQHGCNCPEGFTMIGDFCEKSEYSTPTVTGSTIIEDSRNALYTRYGSIIFNTFNIDGTGDTIGGKIPTSNSWWINPPSSTTAGPMNRSAIWNSSGILTTNFNFLIEVSSEKTYYFGVGTDNYATISIDGTTVLSQNLTALNTFFGQTGDHITHRIWLIYPITLSIGSHIVSVSGVDIDPPGAFGLQIYDNTKSEIKASTSDATLTILMNTKDLIGDRIDASYSCPAGYTLITNLDGTVDCLKSTKLQCP